MSEYLTTRLVMEATANSLFAIGLSEREVVAEMLRSWSVETLIEYGFEDLIAPHIVI